MANGEWQRSEVGKRRDVEPRTIAFLQKATKQTKEAGQIFNSSFPWLPSVENLPARFTGPGRFAALRGSLGRASLGMLFMVLVD